jgi:hypothetical protein
LWPISGDVSSQAVSLLLRKRATSLSGPTCSARVGNATLEFNRVSESFQSIFKLATRSPAREKFLSRVFGIFSEEIVSLWSQDARAPYENLGRPTIYTDGISRGSTLDFTLRERATGKVFVAEMKCEIEYQNFKNFVLENDAQVLRHKKPAFSMFLKLAADPCYGVVKVSRKITKVDGAILIWGALTQNGRSSVRESFGFHDVLSIADICADLGSWDHEKYEEFITQRCAWSNELFAGLIAKSSSNEKLIVAAGS